LPRSSFSVSMYFWWCLPWCRASVSAEITGASASSAYGRSGSSKCSRRTAFAVAVAIEDPPTLIGGSPQRTVLRSLQAQVVLEVLHAAHLPRRGDGAIGHLTVVDEAGELHHALVG